MNLISVCFAPKSEPQEPPVTRKDGYVVCKYAFLRSIVTTQSSDLICGTICLRVNILNLSCMTESFRTRRSKMERNPPSFFWTMKNPVFLLEWGTYFMAPFSNRAFTSCSITRTCWGATLVDNTPINLGGRDPFYILQDPTRYIWQKFPCCHIGGGGVLIGLSPQASGLLSRSLLRNYNGPQIRFTLRRLRLSVLPVSPLLGGGAR